MPVSRSSGDPPVDEAAEVPVRPMSFEAQLEEAGEPFEVFAFAMNEVSTFHDGHQRSFSS
jgi:hypothetical protein